VSPALPSQDREAFTNTLHTCLMNDPPVRLDSAAEYHWAKYDTLEAAMDASARGKNSACHLSNACQTVASNKSGPQGGIPESPWANETSSSRIQALELRFNRTESSGNEMKSLDGDTCDPTLPEVISSLWGRDSGDNTPEWAENSRNDFVTVTSPPGSLCPPEAENPW